MYPPPLWGSIKQRKLEKQSARELSRNSANNQFLQPSTALTKKKAATTTITTKSPPHHKGSNHGRNGRAASSGEGSTETNSPESSDFDDLNSQTCPFCEEDCVHYIETDEDQAGGPLLYCSKGSLCSRRSKATLKSRKVPGKRKKLPLPPKHQLEQPQRHPTVSAFIYEAPNVVRTKASFRDMQRVRKGYCFCVTLYVLCIVWSVNEGLSGNQPQRFLVGFQ